MSFAFGGGDASLTRRSADEEHDGERGFHLRSHLRPVEPRSLGVSWGRGLAVPLRRGTRTWRPATCRRAQPPPGIAMHPCANSSICPRTGRPSRSVGEARGSESSVRRPMTEVTGPLPNPASSTTKQPQSGGIAIPLLSTSACVPLVGLSGGNRTWRSGDRWQRPPRSHRTNEPPRRTLVLKSLQSPRSGGREVPPDGQLRWLRSSWLTKALQTDEHLPRSARSIVSSNNRRTGVRQPFQDFAVSRVGALSPTRAIAHRHRPGPPRGGRCRR